MTAASMTFSAFDQGQASAVQPVESKLGEFANYMSKMGQKAAIFVKDVARNLCQSAASALIAGVLVASALTAVAPALPVGGALVASGFAVSAARTVIEAVVETAVDRTIDVVVPAAKSTTPNAGR